MLRQMAAGQNARQALINGEWGSFIYQLVCHSRYSDVEMVIIARLEEIQKEEKGKNTDPKEIENKMESFLMHGGVRMIELAARETKKSPREVIYMLVHLSRIPSSCFHTELKGYIKERYCPDPLGKMFARADRIAAIPKVTPFGGLAWVGDDDLRTCVLLTRYLNQLGCEFIFPLVIWYIIFDYVLSPDIVESSIPFKCQFFSNVLSESELKKAKAVDFIRSYSSACPNLSVEHVLFLNNLSDEILSADSDEAVRNVIELASRFLSSGSHEALLVHLQSVYPSNSTQVVVASMSAASLSSSSSVNDDTGKQKYMDEQVNKFCRRS